MNVLASERLIIHSRGYNLGAPLPRDPLQITYLSLTGSGRIKVKLISMISLSVFLLFSNVKHYVTGHISRTHKCYSFSSQIYKASNNLPSENA